MRKIIVLEHITIDGVIQGPGGPDEDTSGGFTYGGWIGSYSDEVLGNQLRKQMYSTFDLLLGRKTFEIWEPYWPKHKDVWPMVNSATKYVVSNTRKSSDWEHTVFLSENVVEEVKRLKQLQGPDIHVWGSGELMQTLLRNDLIDEFWLMIYPITLGAGKKLFTKGTIASSFKITESTVTPKGVIIVRYEHITKK